jgi:RHH-type transcriptional regulator, rel operon repressor / antitoxin RelB
LAVSLRLSTDEEKALGRAARKAGISKSEYLRQCLIYRLAVEKSHSWAYEVGKDLFGKYSSGKGDLARNSEKYLQEIIREKASRRRHGTSRRAV